MKTKKINELTMMETVSDAANVLVEENGEAKRIPAGKMVAGSLPEPLQFGETVVGGDTLTWDGNTEGLLCDGGVYYKVSDATPSIEDCANGASMVFSSRDGNREGEELTAESIVSLADGLVLIGEAYSVHETALNVEHEAIGGTVFTEPGTYFFATEGGDYISSLTIPGYAGFQTKTVKTIDTKFLPEHLQFGDEVQHGLVVDSQTVEVEYGYAELYGVYGVFKEGNTYNVVFDDVTYECVAWYHDDWCAVTVGSGAFVEADGVGEDVPFAIVGWSYDSAEINTSNGTHTVEVRGEYLEAKKIGYQYIPEEFVTEDDVYAICSEIMPSVTTFWVWSDEPYLLKRKEEGKVTKKELKEAFRKGGVNIWMIDRSYTATVLAYESGEFDDYASVSVLLRGSGEWRNYYTEEFVPMPV